MAGVSGQFVWKLVKFRGRHGKVAFVHGVVSIERPTQWVYVSSEE